MNLLKKGVLSKMSKKKTHEEYIEELAIKNPNIEVLEQYIGANTPILHHCLIHDINWKTTPNRVLHGTGCKLCGKNKFRKSRLKTHEKYIEEVKITNPYIEVIEKYIDAKTPIKHHCIKHDVFWDASPDNILHGYGCPKCGGNIKKTHEEYVEELYKCNPDIEAVGKYINAKTKILHRCKIDNYEWFISPTHTLLGQGCPQCQESKGERQIRQWLENNNIVYLYQKTFVDCKDKYVLPFDFYIPNYNLCIEFDGKQHFEPVDFSGDGQILALKKFLIVQAHDNIKNQYCRDNNIRLLRIPYFKNIESELETFFIHLI